MDGNQLLYAESYDRNVGSGAARAAVERARSLSKTESPGSSAEPEVRVAELDALSISRGAAYVVTVATGTEARIVADGRALWISWEVLTRFARDVPHPWRAVLEEAKRRLDSGRRNSSVGPGSA